jgi:hypothetical protein
MKNKLITGIIALAMFAFITADASAQTNFSGSWTLDAEKSEGLPPGFKQTMTVTEKDDRVDAEAKIATPNGEQTIKDTYILSGKEVDFTPAVLGGGKAKNGKRTSKRTADGKGFEVVEQATLEGPDGGEATVKVTRRWTLSDDGKTLTIEMTYDGPNGVNKTKRLFVKK